MFPKFRRSILLMHSIIQMNGFYLDLRRYINKLIIIIIIIMTVMPAPIQLLINHLNVFFLKYMFHVKCYLLIKFEKL